MFNKIGFYIGLLLGSVVIHWVLYNDPMRGVFVGLLTVVLYWVACKIGLIVNGDAPDHW